ncbi:MAG: hypothetical protein A3I66_01525 [Burkholderiales bacterium RIFCSPLOWO2_02_FULL_57_36]|nr:MAG: hypothetical protein A3I66_01525 [Burkholderiales bacterium RIFCSPLOWO2_02_FULL_57_36]
MSNFKPPLSFDELHAIGERNRTNADVKALLWEIKRLHAVVSRAHQIYRSNGSIPQFLNEALWNEIKDDPVVKAWEDLNKPKVEPGDDDD